MTTLSKCKFTDRDFRYLRTHLISKALQIYKRGRFDDESPSNLPESSTSVSPDLVTKRTPSNLQTKSRHCKRGQCEDESAESLNPPEYTTEICMSQNLASKRIPSLQNLPYDVLADILSFVADTGFHSYTASKTILSLGLTCHRMATVIKTWTPRVEKALAAVAGNSPLPSPYADNSATLADTCKRLGWICARCNNRAQIFPWVEPFSNLQLCQQCDITEYPKISLRRTRQIFGLFSHWDFRTWNVDYRSPFNFVKLGLESDDDWLFRRSDIQKLSNSRGHKWKNPD